MAQIPILQGEYLADDGRDMILEMKSCLFQFRYPGLSVASQHPSLHSTRRDEAHLDVLLDRRVVKLLLRSNCQKMVTIKVSFKHWI